MKASVGIFIAVLVGAGLLGQSVALAETDTMTKVGVPTVLTGDLSVLGVNLVNTVETYKRHYLRHPIKFIYEDAKKSSLDGLRAYQQLINVEKVEMLIGGTTSNGTIAAKQLVNSSKTTLITPLTGGTNIDNAGEYVFRIGNSDILNGREQAEYFIKSGLRRVALLTEETEYTQDIAIAFRARFIELGGTIVYDENFFPDRADFKTEITRLKSKTPQALFMSTQTGLAFGVFLKQAKTQDALSGIEVHTNFVAASNQDAHEAAGDAIIGVYYMAPIYSAENEELKLFF